MIVWMHTNKDKNKPCDLSLFKLVHPGVRGSNYAKGRFDGRELPVLIYYPLVKIGQLLSHKYCRRVIG